MIIDIFETITNSLASRISYFMQSNPADVTVRINSSGGDVFAALSCFNLLRGKCNVQILGLAASAASLIACAGVKVSAASNALIMIHSPKTLLIDYYDKQSLDKLSNTLAKTEESIVSAYRAKVEGFTMPEEDLWLTASEAKSLGFVDEIIDEVPVVMSAGRTFINAIGYDAAQVKGLSTRLHETQPAQVGLEQLKALIADQMGSGAQGVGSEPPPTAEDMLIKRMVAYANGRLK